MGRYIREYFPVVPAEVAFGNIYSYLATSGYKQEVFDGETVFQKGAGWFSCPKFIKFSTTQSGAIRLEAWTKYALFPSVYIGEHSFEDGGIFMAIDKSSLKQTVQYIEYFLTNPAAYPQNYNGYAPQQPQMQMYPNAPGYNQAQDYNSAQGYQQAPMYESAPAYHVPNAGVKQAKPVSIPLEHIDKKTYVERYAPEKMCREIKSVAICGYVSAGISFLLCVVLASILGILETAVIFGLVAAMHITKKKGFAIAWLVLSIIDVISTIALTGSIGGWLPLIASIYAVKVTVELDKSYDEFCAKQNFERNRR